MERDEMAVFTAEEAAAWSGGVWIGEMPKERIRGISTDTRSGVQGALYVALVGEQFDGHRFCSAAMAGGALGVMVNEDATIPEGVSALRVADTAEALRRLAAGWRTHVGAWIVGITGSVGKTTVKEMTAHVLGGEGPTAKTRGNWNNAIGLPKSLLTMSEGTRYGVFEMGTNHPGEIAPLASLLQPDAAIVTNIGVAHIEHFGTEAATANEKADLIRAIPPSGFVVLDADSPHFAFLRAQARCRVVTTSVTGQGDYHATAMDAIRGHFEVIERGERVGVTLSVGRPGLHQIGNALFAVAVARALGLSWEMIQARFATLSQKTPGRWDVIEREGIQWINDAYNANPASMSKALETFAEVGRNVCGRKIVVLGDMFELGERAEVAHRAIGEQVAKQGFDQLVAVGSMAGTMIVAGALQGGLKREQIVSVPDAEAAREWLFAHARAGDAILLKASHGIGLEKVVAF